MSLGHHAHQPGAPHATGHHHGAADADSALVSLERANRFQEPDLRRIIAELGLPAGSRGLDVGCGVGLNALWLAEAVGPKGRVAGIDPEPERVLHAQRAVSGAGARERVRFEVAEGTALPFPAARFDWLWCGDVLHHVVDTERALSEFIRVVQPGGLIVIKESHVPSAMFLPGHPELERRLQLAEMARSLDEGAGRSFQERRQTTPAAALEAGLGDVELRTYVIARRAPLTDADHAYIQHTVFSRNWGERLRERLSTADWTLRTELCDPASPRNVLRSPAYYCLSPISVFIGRRPA
jgi:ubiquinone/menaquinone biosynthesis C-methylase UbiE